MAYTFFMNRPIFLNQILSEVIAILYVSAYIFVDLCHDQRHAIVIMSDLFSTNSLNDDIFIVSYLNICNFILPKS